MKSPSCFWKTAKLLGLICAAWTGFLPGRLRAEIASEWSVLDSGTTANLWSVAYSADGTSSRATWVAVGEQGLIVTSSDEGATWTRRDSGTTAWLTSVAYISSVKRFFAVGEGGIILSSEDAFVWIREVSPTAIRLNGIAAGSVGNTVRVIGETGAGVLVRSSDGVWTQESPDFSGHWLRGISENYAVGQGGVIFTTNSAVSPALWSAAPQVSAADLESVAYGFISGGITYSTVAVGADGTIIQKSDSGFVPRVSGTTARLNAVCSKVGGSIVLITNTLHPVFSEFFVVGNAGIILRSADGAKWQSDISPTARNLRAVCSAGKSVVAVGDAGTILKIGGADLAPKITRQPTMGYDEAGQAYLDGDASGSGALTFLWVQLTAGAPYPVGYDHPRQLTTKPLIPTGSPSTAVYQLLVANAFGLVWSETVAPNRFRNLSSRAVVSPGESTLICGFSLAGFLPKLERTVLIRAVGPTLTKFGISNSLRAPKLTVFSGSNPIASNTGWQVGSNPGALASAAQTVGAFALSPNDSDSALLLSLPPGNYTAQIESADGTSGVALAEIYDLGAPTLTRLANVSARAQVLPGEGVLIGGLFIDGNLKKKVLLRAAGPALSAFGVNGTLAKPKLTLFRGDAVVATATAWSATENAPALAAAAKTAGAFAFPEGSADAALVLELEPGTYTLMVSGADGASGVALVEAYEIP